MKSISYTLTTNLAKWHTDHLKMMFGFCIGGPTDELHSLPNSSKSALGYTTDSIALLIGIRQVSICLYLPTSVWVMLMVNGCWVMGCRCIYGSKHNRKAEFDSKMKTACQLAIWIATKPCSYKPFPLLQYLWLSTTHMINVIKQSWGSPIFMGFQNRYTF